MVKLRQDRVQSATIEPGVSALSPVLSPHSPIRSKFRITGKGMLKKIIFAIILQRGGADSMKLDDSLF